MAADYQKELQNRIISNNLCSGCGTCAGVCMKDCIHFDIGSHTPCFDSESCVNCGLCYASCPGKGSDKISGSFFARASDVVRPPGFVMITSDASIYSSTLSINPKLTTFLFQ